MARAGADAWSLRPKQHAGIARSTHADRAQQLRYCCASAARSRHAAAPSVGSRGDRHAVCQLAQLLLLRGADHALDAVLNLAVQHLVVGMEATAWCQQRACGESAAQASASARGCAHSIQHVMFERVRAPAAACHPHRLHHLHHSTTAAPPAHRAAPSAHRHAPPSTDSQPAAPPPASPPC